jgi:NTP pyrophosphatase (non-canonical NTP hydrolase)
MGNSQLTFAKVSQTNLERAREWHKGGLEEWSVSDWGVAMAGEAGEVCDAIKKLRRIECQVASENISQPVDRMAAIKAIEQEIGDTFIYLDLLAQRLGINIEDAIRNTFNRVSEREGFSYRL